MGNMMSTRLSVIERARRGDADELAALYAPLVYAMARHRGLDEHDAADIMQQTILEILKLLPGFEYDRSRGRFKGLLKKIVANRTTDLYRRRRPTFDPETVELLAGQEADPAFHQLFEREWIKVHLTAALDRVREEVKMSTFLAFQLTVLEERSVPDVAKTLGLSRNQVSQNKRRILQRLRAHLVELESDA